MNCRERSGGQWNGLIWTGMRFLKKARAERGLSQTQLAQLVGISRNTIRSIETGQFNPTA